MRATILKRTLRVLVISLVLSIWITPLTTLADYATTVYTPNGTAVPAIYTTDELTPDEINAWSNWVAMYYPLATRETNASRRYNCHSYAWHSQSTSNKIWINSPGDNIYWEDGSYVWITTTYGYGSIPSNVPDGAKVSYSWDDHSAIKVSSTKFRSKWGKLPRMKHAPHYSPYYSYSLSYYKRP